MPKEPFFFLKPTTSYLANGGAVEIPRGTIVHHEGLIRYRSSWRLLLILAYNLKVELGVVIGKGGRDIPEASADAHVAGYGKPNSP